MLVLLHGCTTWILIKHLEKKLDGKYTRILSAILNKSWKHPTHPHKIAAVRPLTSNLTNHSSKMRQICWALLEKFSKIFEMCKKFKCKQIFKVKTLVFVLLYHKSFSLFKKISNLFLRKEPVEKKITFIFKSFKDLQLTSLGGDSTIKLGWKFYSWSVWKDSSTDPMFYINVFQPLKKANNWLSSRYGLPNFSAFLKEYPHQISSRSQPLPLFDLLFLFGKINLFFIWILKLFSFTINWFGHFSINTCYISVRFQGNK